MTDYNKIALFALVVVVIEVVALGAYAYESINYNNSYIQYRPICIGGICPSTTVTVKSTTSISTTTTTLTSCQCNVCEATGSCLCPSICANVTTGCIVGGKPGFACTAPIINKTSTTIPTNTPSNTP